jgi:urease accessory protein
MAVMGLRLPAVEPMIAASLLVLGLLLSSQRRLPAVGAALAGGFALFHGAAHGTDLAGASAMAGMLAATVVLHGVGLLAGHRLAQHSVWWARGAGAVVAVMGGTLLLG